MINSEISKISLQETEKGDISLLLAESLGEASGRASTLITCCIRKLVTFHYPTLVKLPNEIFKLSYEMVFL